jgi:hypothetical protein
MNLPMSIPGKYKPDISCLIDMTKEYPELNWQYSVGPSRNNLLLYFSQIKIINISEFNFVASIVQDLYKLRKST